jgi:glycosyltransferase involved in cell wall biosynthesis
MTAKAPLTVVIPTLNEASHIVECVRSAAWAAEIIVADKESTDGTADKARAAGARVLSGTWPTVGAQRNAAIAVAQHPWVFALDADERITPPVADAVTRAVAAPGHEAYAVHRRNVYLGRVMRHAGWGNDWVVRLFRRERRFLEQRAHEHVEPHRDVGRLAGSLEHFPYRDLAHHLQKAQRHAAWGAEDLAERGRRASLVDLLFRPPLRFLRTYFLQLGLLDGWHGAVLSGVASVTVLIKYARLWELQRSADA